MINPHGSSGEVPKVADFLGMSSKSEEQSDLMVYNQQTQRNNTDYDLLGHNYSLPIENSLAVATTNNYQDQLQEKASNNVQSLTLSMGSGKGSTCETSGNENSTATVEATPRRTLDTFGQRTSIYRGVTRSAYIC